AGPGAGLAVGAARRGRGGRAGRALPLVAARPGGLPHALGRAARGLGPAVAARDVHRGARLAHPLAGAPVVLPLPAARAEARARAAAPARDRLDGARGVARIVAAGAAGAGLARVAADGLARLTGRAARRGPDRR